MEYGTVDAITSNTGMVILVQQFHKKSFDVSPGSKVALILIVQQIRHFPFK